MADQGGDYPAVVAVDPPTAVVSVTNQPAPVVDEQPAPVVNEQPAPVVNEQPAPVVDEQPAPVVNEQPAIVVDDYEQTLTTYMNIDAQPGEAIYGQFSIPPTGDTLEPPVETVVEIKPPVTAAVEQPAMADVDEPSAVAKDTTVTFEEPPAVTVEYQPAVALDGEPAVVDVEPIDNAGNDTEPPPLVIVEPVAQPYHPPHEHYEHKRTTTTKKSSKKKPKGSRHIELMEWLPTLPQLFAYQGFTQFLLMFWIFIGECANDVGATWNLVMMWLTVVVTTGLYFVYNLLMAKKCPLRSLAATIFSFMTVLFLFQLPIYLSSTNDSAGGRIVLALVRMIIIALVVVIYSVAYIEDLRSGPVEPGEVVVVETNGRAEPQPVHTTTTISNDYADA